MHIKSICRRYPTLDRENRNHNKNIFLGLLNIKISLMDSHEALYFPSSEHQHHMIAAPSKSRITRGNIGLPIGMVCSLCILSYYVPIQDGDPYYIL